MISIIVKILKNLSQQSFRKFPNSVLIPNRSRTLNNIVNTTSKQAKKKKKKKKERSVSESNM